MDGLIDQAKSQLWSIVNELTKAKCENEDPILEIAIYEYGNDNISSSVGHIRQVLPLITDLDKISTSLFELRTRGGQEYCGSVINQAINNLEWSKSNKDIKMIFIAGNEPFTQVRINYETACGDARSKGIIINTIHCGDYETGVTGKWKSGALIGGGDYMSIEQNKKTIYIPTPYDDRINELSIELNDTYIYYGDKGKFKKEVQVKADEQAESYSKSNLASRNSVKASKYYKNSSWDLVDASEEKDFDIKKVDKNTLPENLKSMSDEDLEKYIAKKKAEREKIKTQIRILNNTRETYLAQQSENGVENVESSMIKSIKKQALSKNFTW
jgi:hypothetical protein